MICARSIVLLSIGLAVAACSRGGDTSKSPPPSVPVQLVEAHRGATALLGGTDLLLSFAQDWDRPGPVRLSRGLGPVQRTLTGWPAGVSAGKAYALVPRGDRIDVVRVALEGEPVSLGQVPAPEEFSRPLAAVAGGIVAVNVGGPTIHLFDDRGAREVSVVDDSEALVTLAGNPEGAELLAVLRYARGTPPPGPRQRLVLIDANAGSVRWEQPVGSLPASEGEAEFVAGGSVLVHHDGDFVLHDIATGAATPKWSDVNLDARSMTISRAGDRIAYTRRVGTGHWALTDPGCLVYLRDSRANDELLTSFDGDCYFGLGLLFAGRELWVAPP